MKQLLYKEYKLCLVSMVPIFYLFALMLLIPNYPYLVAAFFTCNSIFFLFKQSVVNGDLLFTTLLPVAKGDVVRARVRFVVIIQMIMFLLFIPLCYANHLLVPRNPAGTAGSLTFLAAALVLFTIFNGTFLPGFYRNEHKMDKLFLISLIAVFGWIILWEGFMITAGAAERLVPFFAWVETHLDCWPATGEAWTAQLVALAVGALVYVVGNILITRRAVAVFERVDL